MAATTTDQTSAATATRRRHGRAASNPLEARAGRGHERNQHVQGVARAERVTTPPDRVAGIPDELHERGRKEPASPEVALRRERARHAGKRHEHHRAEDDQAAARRDEQAGRADPRRVADRAADIVDVPADGRQARRAAEQGAEPGPVESHERQAYARQDEHRPARPAATRGARPDQQAAPAASASPGVAPIRRAPARGRRSRRRDHGCPVPGGATRTGRAPRQSSRSRAPRASGWRAPTGSTQDPGRARRRAREDATECGRASGTRARRRRR